MSQIESQHHCHAEAWPRKRPKTARSICRWKRFEVLLRIVRARSLLIDVGVTINRFSATSMARYRDPFRSCADFRKGNGKATFAVSTGEYGRIFPAAVRRATETVLTRLWRSLVVT